MKTIEDLINTLDSEDQSSITKDDLFEIETTYDHSGNDEVGCSIKEASNEDTEPGAILVWEFNDTNLDQAELDVNIAAIRLRRFVELLERLDISTRHDCWDSYGSQDENSRTATIEQMCFETDKETIEEIIMPLVVKSGLMTKHDFEERFL